MKLDTIKLLRNVLLRTFAVTFVFNLLMALATFGMWDTWTSITGHWFHTDPQAMGPLMVNFFTATKFFALFVLLGPALALHWTVRAEERKAA